MKSIALLWNRGMRPLSIIACLVLEHKGKSRSSALTGNSDWTGSWGNLGGVWHLALPFDEYFRKFWYPHLQWFQRSTDNCGKIHVRIILGHPIVYATRRAEAGTRASWGPHPVIHFLAIIFFSHYHISPRLKSHVYKCRCMSMYIK